VGNRRNSSIELLKVMAIFIIIMSHITMDISVAKPIINNGYLLNLSHATTDIQQFVLTLFRYLGNTGNYIFFICSAWFLTDIQKVNYKKLFHMVAEVWSISVLFLAIAIVIIPGGGTWKRDIKSNHAYYICK